MEVGRVVETSGSRDLNVRPSIPIRWRCCRRYESRPVVESRRRRIILKGNVVVGLPLPHPLVAREARNSERCVTEDPELRLLDTRHEVACHFAEDVDGSTEQVQATGRPKPGDAAGD